MVKRHSSISTTQMIAILISKSAHRPFLRRSYLKISPTTSQSVVPRLSSRAEVYNENFATADINRFTHLQEYCRDQSQSWSLNERWVEDAWFLWVLVNVLQNEGKLATTNFYTPHNTSHRKDIDSIADEAWQLLCSKTSPWVHHVWNKKGCAEGMCLCVCVFWM